VTATVGSQPIQATAAAPNAVPRLPPTKYTTMYALLNRAGATGSIANTML
jgi:hypothetical protein